MLKVHSGHRYRPHRTVRLRLNTQVREKEGRVRPFSVFEPHNREQTYASGIPFCSAYCPERTHKYTFYPIKMQEIPTKTSFMDNYSFAAPCRQPPPFACLPSCLLLPPSASRLPSAACRLPSASTLRLPSASTLRLPSASTHAPLLYAAPPLRTSPSIRAATNFPNRPATNFPRRPATDFPPGRDGLPSPAATDFPPRPRQTSLPGCDGLPSPAATDKKKCDPKVALESFQISVKQIFTNSISIPPR